MTFETNDSIQGTEVPELYKSERWDQEDGTNLKYTIPVPNDTYDVQLHFAEIYAQAPGFRVFDVKVQGKLAFEGVDIFAERGHDTALIKTKQETVDSGYITIELIRIPGKNNPKISGIAIFPSQTLTQESVYINAGGATFADGSGRIWWSDEDPKYSYHNTGVTWATQAPIGGRQDLQALYQTERWDPIDTTELRYRIPLTSGTYIVKLHFAEIYAQQANFRVFDVKIQGQDIFKGIDIFAEVGFRAPLVKETNVAVSGGELTIELDHIFGKDNPKISGIEVIPTNGAPPVPQPVPVPPPSSGGIYINAGGITFNDGSRVWYSDEDPQHKFHNTGAAYTSNDVIGGTTVALRPLYQSERWNPEDGTPLVYTIPLSNGNYVVRLHFAEIYARQANVRIFNVKVQGVPVIRDLDIFAEVGHDVALVKVTTAAVVNGKLTIELEKVLENPKINGIEIIPGDIVQPPVPVPVPEPAKDSVYINCGGGDYTDTNGRLWHSDRYYNTGLVWNTKSPIGSTENDSLYQTERWDEDDGTELKYTIPVKNGSYMLSLHFAEIYGSNAGFRIFDVKVQGKPLFQMLDIFASAPGKNVALVRSTVVDVKNSELTIELIRVKNNPKISAIQIEPATTSPSVFINTGGGTFTDTLGITWIADSYFNAVGSISVVDDSISGCPDPRLYQSERWDSPNDSELKYTVPVAGPGDYEVTLHFSETYPETQSSGARVFTVMIQGEVAFANLDIFKEVGGYAALSKKRVVQVSESKTVSIELIHVIENPTISGIEIRPFSGTVNTPPIFVPPVTSAPSLSPVEDPTTAPSPSPVGVPSASAPSATPVLSFSPYHINVGGPSFIDKAGTTWEGDGYSGGTGRVLTTKNPIENTVDEILYKSERWGSNLKLEIPVPNGDYEVTLHFAEIYFRIDDEGERKFHVLMEGIREIENLDVFKEAGGSYKAWSTVKSVRVVDQSLTIQFEAVVDQPKLSGVEINLIGHYAHAVPGGPYIQTDTDNDGFETVFVDGSFSHTHGPGATLRRSRWLLNGQQKATGIVASIKFPVGVHTLVMEVEDTDGSVSQDFTTVTIRPFGYPDITALEPDNGDVSGGETVRIVGFGFNASPSNTTVFFGLYELSGSQIKIVNSNIIEVTAPANVAGEINVAVVTRVGQSNVVAYKYVNFRLPPVSFVKGNVLPNNKISTIYGPSTLAFAPNGKLYVGTVAGVVHKLTLDDQYQVTSNVTSYSIANSEPNITRTILGLAFDPMDTSLDPKVYVSHGYLFHGEVESYNGKISVLEGTTLNLLGHVVTGLPISDHDHCVNGIIFGDQGEMYIQNGGNTNAGVPGDLSQSGLQKEGYFSAATLVARNIASPTFDGKITYFPDGTPKTGLDVQVFAPGQRNSYDILLHSNGHLYAADNGPNNLYGPSSETCTTEGYNPTYGDELNLIEKNRYYGHANRLRGQTDPRQCVYRGTEEPGDAVYTAPIALLKASFNGIAEFETNHFGGQLRGHIILGRYQGELWHATLTPDGRSIINNVAVLVEDGGLDVTQGPDGTLFVAQNFKNKIIYHKPSESSWLYIKVKSVFPRRGGYQGGTPLSIFGENFNTFGTPTVTVGGKDCPLIGSASYSKITCTLPAGVGKADVVVSAGDEYNTLEDGYRYIPGYPVTVPSPVSSPVPATAISLSAVDDFVAVQGTGLVEYYEDIARNALAVDSILYPDQFAAAETTYDGANGSFTVVLTALTEIDGECTYKLFVNGIEIGSAQNPASVTDWQPVNHSWNNVLLSNGDVIQVHFNSASNDKIPEGNGFAYARGRWTKLAITG
jgi:glucose/arabinose dehydrogenase